MKITRNKKLNVNSGGNGRVSRTKGNPRYEKSAEEDILSPEFKRSNTNAQRAIAELSYAAHP